MEVPAWFAWLTAATRTMLELWRQLMTAPLLPAIPLPHSGAAMHAGHFMTASRAQCACVRLHSVAAAATS